MSSSITVDRILQLAEDKGVTLEFLGDLIGAYRGKTGAWKSGRLAPTFSELNTLANYFNVSLDYLLGHSHSPDPPAVPNAPTPVPPVQPIQGTKPTPSGGSYLFIADGGSGRRIAIPSDKVYRVLKLIDAAFPEIMEKS